MNLMFCGSSPMVYTFVGSKNMELQLFFNLFQMPPRNPGKGCCGGEGAEKDDPVPVTLATLQHWSRPPLQNPNRLLSAMSGEHANGN